MAVRTRLKFDGDPDFLFMEIAIRTAFEQQPRRAGVTSEDSQRNNLGEDPNDFHSRRV